MLHDKNDISTKYSELDIRKCRELQQQGIIAGGMIPKVECCVRALSQVRRSLGICVAGVRSRI